MSDVLSLLSQRQSLKGQGLPFADGAHLALVIEGGGMRGAYLAGMLTALRDHDTLPLFDSVHACSVGAHLASYFLAEQIDLASSIFWEEALSSAFISFPRVFRFRPIMDVAWLVHQVYCRLKRIDFASLEVLSHKLFIQCLSVSDATPVRFRASDHMAHLPDILHATAAIPLLAGRPVSIQGKAFVDGGLYESIPLESALAHGATHVVVLLTRKRTPEGNGPSPLACWVEKTLLRLFYGTRLAQAYSCSVHKMHHTLQAFQQDNPFPGVSVLPLFAPDDAPALDRLERNPSAIRAAFHSCHQSVSRLLSV